METWQKNYIKSMRQRGRTYVEIGKELHLPANTIKAYCWRNQIQVIDAETLQSHNTSCIQCGAEIIQKPKCKPKKFCSDVCRRAWWNEHRDLGNKKAYYTVVCANCGKEFQAYGDKKRKYCSTPCYFEDRFKTVEQTCAASDFATPEGGIGLSYLPEHCQCATCPWFVDGKRSCVGKQASSQTISADCEQTE